MSLVDIIISDILLHFSVSASHACQLPFVLLLLIRGDTASTAILVDLAECWCAFDSHYLRMHAGASQCMLNDYWCMMMYSKARGCTILTIVVVIVLKHVVALYLP